MVGMLDEVLSSVEDPWRSKCLGIFSGLSGGHCIQWEEVQIFAGSCDSIVKDTLCCKLASFIPTKGFIFDVDASSQCSFRIPRLTHRATLVREGTRFVCAGAFRREADLEWVADPNVVLLLYPEFSPDDQWNAIHAFAGSFCGWSQAFGLLPKMDPSLLLGSQVFIDNDHEVIQTWTHKLRQPCLQSPLIPRCAFEPRANTVIHADIKDWSVLHAVSSTTNLILTASPPCISWSRGGKMTGLSSAAGFAFIEGVMLVAASQPLALGLECAAEVPSHKHFPIVDELLHRLGYRCLWHKISHLQTISHTARSRWLGLWMRLDCMPGPCSPPADVVLSKVLPWSAQEYNFVIPRSMLEQLVLSTSEKAPYSDWNLLPASKRHDLPRDTPASKVLESRMQRLDEMIPTLCASYSTQHQLSMSHLQDKGIFAVLHSRDEQPAFFDPFRFIAMFGAVENVVVSAKLGLAFRQIGNAVAVPQALMVLISGVATLTRKHFDHDAFITQEWNHRTTSYTGFIISDDRFHVLCPSVSAVTETTFQSPVVAPGVQCVVVHLLHNPTCVRHTSLLPCASTVGDFFRPFSWKYPIQEHMHLWHDEERICNLHSIEHLANLSSRWFLYLAGRLLAVIDFDGKAPAPTSSTGDSKPRSDHNIQVQSEAVVSPTAPYTVPSDGRAQGVAISLDQLLGHRTFCQVLRANEADDRAHASCERGVFFLSTPAVAFTAPAASNCSDVLGSVFPPSKRRCIAPRGSDDAWVSSCTTEETPAKPVVALFSAQPLPWFVTIEEQPSSSNLLKIDSGLFKIHCVNGVSVANDVVNAPLQHGDFLHVSFQGPNLVLAGGHHGSDRLSIPQGASFATRCEFAINSSGWLASDEMQHFLDYIQWLNPIFALITPIVLWDLNLLDFDLTATEEIQVPNNRLTLMPVLCNAHWAAVEIHRSSHRTIVTILGFPGTISHHVADAVARLLDLTVYRIQLVRVELPPRDHMCGWQILLRWLSHANLADQVPPEDDGYWQTSLECRHLIDDVLVSAVQDWQCAGIPMQEWIHPARLRLFSPSLLPLAAAKQQWCPSPCKFSLLTAICLRPLAYRPLPSSIRLCLTFMSSSACTIFVTILFGWLQTNLTLFLTCCGRPALMSTSLLRRGGTSSMSALTSTVEERLMSASIQLSYGQSLCCLRGLCSNFVRRLEASTASSSLLLLTMLSTCQTLQDMSSVCWAFSLLPSKLFSCLLSLRPTCVDGLYLKVCSPDSAQQFRTFPLLQGMSLRPHDIAT